MAPKAEVLPDVSKNFDSLGFLVPITVQAKLFMLELWQRRIKWDEPLPTDLRTNGLKLQATFSKFQPFPLLDTALTLSTVNDTKQILIFVCRCQHKGTQGCSMHLSEQPLFSSNIRYMRTAWERVLACLEMRPTINPRYSLLFYHQEHCHDELWL